MWLTGRKRLLFIARFAQRYQQVLVPHLSSAASRACQGLGRSQKASQILSAAVHTNLSSHWGGPLIGNSSEGLHIGERYPCVCCAYCAGHVESGGRASLGCRSGHFTVQVARSHLSKSAKTLDMLLPYSSVSTHSRLFPCSKYSSKAISGDIVVWLAAAETVGVGCTSGSSARATDAESTAAQYARAENFMVMILFGGCMLTEDARGGVCGDERMYRGVASRCCRGNREIEGETWMRPDLSGLSMSQGGSCGRATGVKERRK